MYQDLVMTKTIPNPIEGGDPSKSSSSLKPLTPADQGITRRGQWKLYAMFLFFGFGTLATWNVLLDASLLVGVTIMPASMLSQLILTVTMGFSAATCVFLTLTTGYTMNRWSTRIFICSGLLGFILFPIPTYFFETEKESGSAGAIASVSLLCIPLGIALGGIQTQGFAYGGCIESMAEIGTRIVSLAQSLAGLIIWVIFTIFDTGIFSDKNDVKQQQGTLWVLQSLGLTFFILTIVVYELVLKVPAFDRVVGGGKKIALSDYTLQDTEKGSKSHTSVPTVATLEDSHYGIVEEQKKISIFEKFSKDVLIRATYPAMRPGIVLCMTLSLFPAVGPGKWDSSLAAFHVGVFQVNDMVVRLALIQFKWLHFSERVVDIMIYSRLLIMFPLYLIPATSLGVSMSWLRNEVFLFFMSFAWVWSHALLMPSACVSCMTKPKSHGEVEAFACLMTVSIVFLGWVGTFIAQGLTSIL